MEMERHGAWCTFKHDWQYESASNSTVSAQDERTWSMWSTGFVAALSHHENVESVFALGSVLAVFLKDPSGSGYTSTAATGLRDTLLRGADGDDAGDVVHSRVLGNVLYLMASMTTTKSALAEVEMKVGAAMG